MHRHSDDLRHAAAHPRDLLLAADRYAGMHFFTDNLGGNMMNYVNLFWLFGHPEVYILILPAFGVYSEVISTFSSKELYGYTSLVIATAAIAVLSFTVWLHHFFTMGQNADINAAFGIATMRGPTTPSGRPARPRSCLPLRAETTLAAVPRGAVSGANDDRPARAGRHSQSVGR